MRLNNTVDIDLNAEFWFGAAIYVPVGFYAAQNAQVRSMGWTDYDGVTQHLRGGLWINSTDDVYIYRHTENTGVSDGQVPLISLGNKWLPEGQWSWVDIHQKLSATDGSAITEAFKNGVQAGSTVTTHNINSSLATGQITRLRFGLDDATGVTNALYLIFDRCYLALTQLGPPSGGGGSGAPAGTKLSSDAYPGGGTYGAARSGDAWPGAGGGTWG